MQEVPRKQLVNRTLTALLGTGGVNVSLLSPSVLRSIDPILKKLSRERRETELQRVRTYLRTRGYVEYAKGARLESALTLTVKGRRRAERLLIDQIEIPIRKRWDKTWRVIIFDIPEKSKPARETLVRKLKNIGFYQLQRSVWIFPHPCEEEIKTLLHMLGLESYATVMTTRQFDKSKKLELVFNLR